ncbi:MAG: hypothetical protein ABSE90_13255 [Verrucomicrobiota bacterium]|jgi:hypothetical protein
MVEMAVSEDSYVEPQVRIGSGSFGVRTNRFVFNIGGNGNLVVVVEARTNLADPVFTASARRNGSGNFTKALIRFAKAGGKNFAGIPKRSP